MERREGVVDVVESGMGAVGMPGRLRSVAVTLQWSEHGDLPRLVPSSDATDEEKAFIAAWVDAWQTDHSICLGLGRKDRAKRRLLRRQLYG